MSHFPKTLYRSGSQLVLGEHSADTLIVNDDAEFDAALADGWLTVDDFLDTDPVSGADSQPSNADAVAELFRDELLAADEKLRTRDTEINLSNDRIATLEAENADLKAQLAARVGGNPAAQDLPALTGKTKAELLDIAAAEGATVEAGSTNADIIAAIELKREAGA